MDLKNTSTDIFCCVLASSKSERQQWQTTIMSGEGSATIFF